MDTEDDYWLMYENFMEYKPISTLLYKSIKSCIVNDEPVTEIVHEPFRKNLLINLRRFVR